MIHTTYDWGMEGHQRQRRILEKAVQTKRSHAFMLYGPADIGKRRLADRFAAMQRCTSEDKRPCGSCESCMSKLAELESLSGLILVPGESDSIGVDQMRDFLANFRQKGFSPSHRVGMIIHADKMQTAAANAFLKHLEEPASGVSYILIADATTRIPATVLSRCTLLKLLPYSKYEMMQELLLTGADSKAVESVIQVADGRIDFALTLLGKGLKSFSARYAATLDLLGADLHEQIRQLEAAHVFKAANDDGASSTRLHSREMYTYIELALRDLALVRAHAEDGVRFRHSTLRKLADRFSLQALTQLLLSVQALRYTLERNGNQRLAWEQFLLTLHRSYA